MATSPASFTFHSNVHGLISVTQSAPIGHQSPTLLLIHGNSSSSKIFKNFLHSEALCTKYRLVTFDLPGHGASSDSPNHDSSYSMRGYAELTRDIIGHMNLKSVVVLGWSLGGHIAIELIPLLPPGVLHAIMLVGTPPALGLEQMSQAFTFSVEDSPLASKENLTEEENKLFAGASIGESFKLSPEYDSFLEWMEADIRRAHGRARWLMWGKFAQGIGVDQRKLMEEKDILVAVVNGAEDAFVNLGYLKEIKWKRLWEGQCIELDGLGHIPFYENYAQFEALLLTFLEDVKIQHETDFVII